MREREEDVDPPFLWSKDVEKKRSERVKEEKTKDGKTNRRGKHRRQKGERRKGGRKREEIIRNGEGHPLLIPSRLT